MATKRGKAATEKRGTTATAATKRKVKVDSEAVGFTTATTDEEEEKDK